MDTWASLLEKSPFIAIILALGIVVIYLFRSRERLQTKYIEDIIKATEAMNLLATENLKQSFSDSAAWRDNVRDFGETLKSHMREESENYAALTRAIDAAKTQVIASELAIKQLVSDTADRRTRG